MLCARHLFRGKSLSPQFLSVFTLPDWRNLSSQKQEAVLPELEENENEALAREAEIEKKRNKSGLRSADYNRQHDKPPYDEPMTAYQETMRYKRKMYGRYGESSKVNPSILWPSKVELTEMKKYLEVAQPFTVQELLKRLEEKKQMEKEERKKLEAEILEKVRRVPKEIEEFKKRVEQKRLKAEELIEQKNRLILETKKHFDYPIDVRDEKFQMKMEELKNEERKKQKMEKKQKKMEKKKRFQDTNKESEEPSEEV